MSKLELYEAERPLIATADIVNWQMDSLFGRFIRLFTEDSHTSTVCRLDEWHGMKDRIFIVEATTKTQLSLLSRRLQKAHGTAYLLRLQRRWNPVRPYIAGWVCEQVGTPYDVGGLCRNLFGRVSIDMKHYFCSSLAYVALLEGAKRYEAERGPLPQELKYDLRESTSRLKGKVPRPGDFRNLPMFGAPEQIL
jgi:hypothetical protein